MNTIMATTYDKTLGRVDWGETTQQAVIFLTPWPNRPSVLTNGLYIIGNISNTGFSLDREPEEPVHWVAQESPVFIFDIEDVRRMLDGVHTFTPDEAEAQGAFTDDAITEDEARASLVDLEEAMRG